MNGYTRLFSSPKKEQILYKRNGYLVSMAKKPKEWVRNRGKKWMTCLNRSIVALLLNTKWCSFVSHGQWTSRFVIRFRQMVNSYLNDRNSITCQKKHTHTPQPRENFTLRKMLTFQSFVRWIVHWNVSLCFFFLFVSTKLSFHSGLFISFIGRGVF